MLSGVWIRDLDGSIETKKARHVRTSTISMILAGMVIVGLLPGLAMSILGVL